MEIKAVAIDLDGTLLNSKREISGFNKAIIHKLVKKGIKVYLATGRLYKSLYKYKKFLELDSFVIASNGALLIDGKTDKVLMEFGLKEKQLKTLIKIARENDIHLNVFQGDNWYVEKLREEVKLYKNSSGLDYKLKNFDDLKEELIPKVMFIAEHEKLLNIEKKIEVLELPVYKAFSKPHYLEILNQGVSKGNTILKLLEKEGIKASECMAFGDGFNDFEMLNEVGMGIIMKNAPEKLKEKFEFIAETNDDDGVGKFLKKYFEL